MPIYEYLCESCGKVNERLQKVSDPPPSRCEECGAKKLAKLVSRSAFQLKGGGWYSDLYSSKKKETPSSEGEPAPAAPAAPATPGTPAAAEKAGPEKAGKKESPAPARATTPPAGGAAKGAPKDRKKGGR